MRLAFPQLNLYPNLYFNPEINKIIIFDAFKEQIPLDQHLGANSKNLFA